MQTSVHQHIRQNVVGYVALFLVLCGGVAYAGKAGKNSVNSRAIKDNQVRSADVRDDTKRGGGLQAVDLAAGSVGASEVIDDALTGTEIQESTLDPGVVQFRIGSDCDAGEAIRAVGADGTVTCEPLGGGAPGGPAGGDLAGTYPDPSLAANAVQSGEIADGEVTGADVDESTLGQVPSAAQADSATSADSADDADLLDGQDSSAFPRVFAEADDSFAPGVGTRLEVNVPGVGATFVVTCLDGGTPGSDADDQVAIDVVNVGAGAFEAFVDRANAVGSTSGVNAHVLTRTTLAPLSSVGGTPAAISNVTFYVYPGAGTTTVVAHASGHALTGGSDNCTGAIQATRSG